MSGSSTSPQPDSTAALEPFHSEGRPGPDGTVTGVLLSHGFTGSPVSMRPWGDYLAELGYAVSVPRLPGHGTKWQDMVPTTFADYYAELERAYEELSRSCDQVVVGGLSMGGSLAIWLAAAHPEIKGLMLVNAAVASSNKQLLAVPVLKHVLKALPGIGNDIKLPGADEHGYDKVPLRPLASMVQGWKHVRSMLPSIQCPVIVFRSVTDHVVDPSSGRIILAEVGSSDTEEVLLHNSYHVATIDHDAPEIFETSATFIARVAGEPPPQAPR